MTMNVLLFMVSCILTNNFIFSRFLGCCPFLGVSGKVETSVSMGLAVTFVMTIASLFCWLIYNLLLVPLGLTILNTIAFILVIAALVQFVEMFLKKSSPTLYSALGIYLPLITTNCAVLGVATLNMNNGYGLLQAVLNGTFSALGFLLAIVLMAGVRERLESSKIPACMKGFPITLVSAGLMAVEQADTGTKMIHLGKNTRSTIISKGISAGHSQNGYRGLVRVAAKAENARNYSQCDSLLLGDQCGAHTWPYVECGNESSILEHEATTSKISEDQLFYCQQRGIPTEKAIGLIVNGYAKDVLNKLPMEFAVEAQKLLSITLEGSVG